MTKYNPSNLDALGKHDFDDAGLINWIQRGAKTASVGIFQWKLKANGKSLKRGKTKVRCVFNGGDLGEFYSLVYVIRIQLDKGNYDGPKTITIK